MTPARRLALCVDDFGLHAGVNAAVLQLAALGRLNAVGCMVGAPAWREGAPRLAQLDPSATDIGLHLDFTEHPLGAGSRFALPALILRAYARTLDAPALRHEIVAQLDAFEAGVGRPPDYIDGHQHVHQLPLVRDTLVALLRQRGWRPWLRCTRRPAAGAPGFKPWLIAALGANALARLARDAGLLQNAHLLGVYGFEGDAAGYRARLSQWLAAATDGDVLMCHPSLAVGADADPLMAARTTEYAQFADPSFATLLERAGITLAPISRIARH
jgi:predicted glycoside hydrolase/deacetylase ChbG (UPF0249 family)